MLTAADMRNGYEPARPGDNPTIDCSDMQDMARQEFKDETNVNNIIQRFLGTGVPPVQRQPVFGDRDFDIDLHGGYLAVENAQRAFLRLPKALKDKYKNTQGLLDAMWRGEFKDDVIAERTAELDRQEAAAGQSETPPTVQTR